MGDYHTRLVAFRDEHVIPNEARFDREVASGETRWKPVPVLEELRAKARREGLWNLSLGRDLGGPGFSHHDYAQLAEVMGCNEWMPEIFNCNPPDSGNIDVLARFCTPEQQDRWLQPLLAGEIRSAFAMSEPGVASSDATNISLSAELDREHWVLNGEKWWISGAGNPLCHIFLTICRTDPDAGRTKKHSMILVPRDTPGFSVVRQMTVFGIDFAPRGFSHIKFDNVRVPRQNLVGIRGQGLEIAQARLGPARLHHAMRCVGAAERALKLMCERSEAREAFGKRLSHMGSNADLIAQSRIEIDMVREYALSVARGIDQKGLAAFRTQMSQIKVAAPDMACRVLDRAIQLHGAAGFSQDTPLAALFARLRTIRMADGPDAVHMRVIARTELGKYRNVDDHAGNGSDNR